MISLQQARTTLTRAQGVDIVLQIMRALGFETTGWQNGRNAKTVVTTIATVVSDFSETTAFIANATFNAYARGESLNRFSKSRFNNEKVKAVATVGPCTLRNVTSSPHTLSKGALLATTADGVQFTLDADVTIPAGTVPAPGVATPAFRCRVRGSVGNVPGSAINKLLTPIAGVTILNDAGTPWYSTTGLDLESDASLQARNPDKWALQTVEYVADSYKGIARAAGAAKVTVDDANPRGPGTIDVYCAAPTALLSDAELEAIQLAFSLRAVQTSSTWPAASDSRVAVKHPPVQPIDIGGTIYFDSNLDVLTMQTRIRAALLNFLSVTDIGGWIYEPSDVNVVLLSDIVDVIKDTPGVQAFVPTAPVLQATPVGTGSLVTEGTWAFTFTPRASQRR